MRNNFDQGAYWDEFLVVSVGSGVVNPGLAAIWEDERQRRSDDGVSETPRLHSQRPPLQPTDSDLYYRQKIKAKLESLQEVKLDFASPVKQAQNLLRSLEKWRDSIDQRGSCHKRQKPQAPTPQAPIRNRQTRKVANAKGLNRNTNLASPNST